MLKQVYLFTVAGILFGAATASGTQRIGVVVHDYAEINPSMLERAEREAARILRTAGVDVAWINCRNPTEWVRPFQMPPNNSTELVLDLLGAGATRRNAEPEALGFAVPPESGAFGWYGGVFYDRVKRLSSTMISESVLLAHAISHELGHLLLGVGPHTRSGIMKSEWHKKELVEAGRGTLLFRDEDRLRIEENVRRRVLHDESEEQIHSRKSRTYSYPRATKTASILDLRGGRGHRNNRHRGRKRQGGSCETLCCRT